MLLVKIPVTLPIAFLKVVLPMPVVATLFISKAVKNNMATGIHIAGNIA